MKKNLTILLSILFIFQANAQQLAQPSSTVYDTQNDRYLVGNAGDGKILITNENGDLSLFKEGLTGVLGMVINNGILYVSDGWLNGTMVYGYDLTTAEEVFSINITDAGQVNDLVFDGIGNLYVSDRETDSVYKINVQDDTYSLFLDGTTLFRPNGMTYIAPNRLLVVSSSDFGYIYEVDLNTSIVTIVAEGQFASLDGITKDLDGNIYITSWGADSYTNDLFYFPNGDFSQAPQVLLSNGDGMGDLSYDNVNNILAIPNWWDNSVTFLHLPFVDNKEAQYLSDHLINISPNPLNGKKELNIKSEFSSDYLNWNCRAYNTNGEFIGKWEILNINKATINFFTTNLPSGTYILLFENGEKRIIKKLVVQ